MNTLQEVSNGIMQANFTNDELNKLAEIIQFRRGLLAKLNKRTFSIGSKVKFTSTRSGLTMSGSVSKIAIKFITVLTPTGNWKVPANMLSAA